MNLAELAAELALPAYAGMTAQQKADALNAPKEGVSFAQLVYVADVLRVMGQATFRAAALEEPSRTGWLQTLENIRALKDGLVPSQSGVAEMLAGAVLAGVLTAEEKAALDALGMRLGSRAEELFGEGTVVSLNDVARVS